MKIKTIILATIGAAALYSSPVWAQGNAPANPKPGCSASASELEAARKIALVFASSTGEAKIALADPSYIQHNPASHKRAREEKVSDYEQFKEVFRAQAAASGSGTNSTTQRGLQPPTGNRMEIVLAECDIVTVIHKVYRQDPTAQPGTFYEAFTFDAYRVKDGRVVEHWDDGVIAPPKQ